MTAFTPRLKSDPAVPPLRASGGLGVTLLRDGLVAPDEMVKALALQARHSGRLADILRARGTLADGTLIKASAQAWGVRTVDPLHPLPDPRLIDSYGAAECLRDGILPWRHAGGTTVIATARPEDFLRRQARLQQLFGPVSMVLAPATAIEQAVLARRGAALAHAAETRVPDAESCRTWNAARVVPRAALCAALGLAALWWQPVVLGLAALALALMTLVLTVALKIAATVATLRPAPRSAPPPAIARLPTVSVIVAMYREGDIAARLVRRLSRLDYPPALLDVVLAVEAEDRLTRDALATASLPTWMRVVVVPAGHVKTKPRALNMALDQCRGSIIGVYDAEDAPEPDQIRKVVDRFHQRGPQVACLQGVLDFYNPRTNWLSRCFTMEYAMWFRLVLPGLARLGLVVPLGGTTLFFRRDVLEKLGGWDAHNVTEDADLGLRLARHGYRTELIETTTFEEANCRALPWVKQRSRWIKGYMMTWAVHMRNPVQLWRDLGAWRFFGVQVLFAGSLIQFLLAPLLWSLWAVALGLPHPLAATLPAGVTGAVACIFLLTEAVSFGLGLLALRRTAHRLNPCWLLTLPVYFPLAAAASYKAAWELVTRPFYWDKTTHGIFDPGEAAPVMATG
ncbi:MAG: glycosyltransferase [Pseudomonadota bacterium]